jgi:hypothetical protein
MSATLFKITLSIGVLLTFIAYYVAMDILSDILLNNTKYMENGVYRKREISIGIIFLSSIGFGITLSIASIAHIWGY